MRYAILLPFPYVFYNSEAQSYALLKICNMTLCTMTFSTVGMGVGIALLDSEAAKSLRLERGEGQLRSLGAELACSLWRKTITVVTMV